MKKILAFSLAFALVFVFCIQSAYADSCKAPSSSSISLNTSGQHSATAKVSGISKHAACDFYDNNVNVSIHVKVGVRPGSSQKWYNWTNSDKDDQSSWKKTQTVTPAAHYLVGAEGSWTVVCNNCDRNTRAKSGDIAYKKVS